MAEAASSSRRRDPRGIALRVVKEALPTGQVVGALVPRFATDERMLRERGYRIGDDLIGQLRKPRILGQHRRAHLLGALVVAQLDGFESLGQHDAIKRLQKESGICCDVEQIEAAPVVEAIVNAAGAVLGDWAQKMLASVLPAISTIELTVPRSLAFDKMEQGEFEAFYRGICAHLCARYWPDCTPEQVEQMAELMDKEVAR